MLMHKVWTENYFKKSRQSPKESLERLGEILMKNTFKKSGSLQAKFSTLLHNTACVYFNPNHQLSITKLRKQNQVVVRLRE